MAENTNGTKTEMTTESSNEVEDIGVYTQKVLQTVLQCVKSSNALPAEGDDYDFYSSFPGFQEIMEIEGKRILHIIQNIMKHQLVKGSVVGESQSSTEIEDRFEHIIDANDQLLEKIGNLLDEASGIKKQENTLVITNFKPKQTNIASWNKKQSPANTPAAPNNYRLITGRQLVRPQTKFTDDIDNSNSSFVPRIRRKPNALKSLEESLKVDANAENISDPDFSYPHPYAYELEHWKAMDHQLQKSEAKFPKPITETSLGYIDTVGKLEDLCRDLAKEEVIAVDLEHHSYRTFQGLTCLMQISTYDQDFIIDTLELRKELELLNDVFTDPKIVKVFHGANCDVDWLQRDFGIYVVNMFDTGQASRILNYERFSLSYLMERYCQKEIDKQYRLADWRIRPLPDVLINYAREDTHYLLYIYNCMKNELIEKGNLNKNLVKAVLQRSTEICKKVYTKPIYNDESYQVLYKKSRKTFNPQQMFALKKMHSWREKTARSQDESLNYVLPNHMLLQIAEILPRERQGVLACCNPIPPLIRQYLQEIHGYVLEARDITIVKQRGVVPEKKESVSIDPKYDMNKLLEYPHDLSHQINNKDNEPENFEDTLMANKLNGAELSDNSIMNLKEHPFLSAFDWFSAKNSQNKNIAADLKESFKSPFTMFFPVNQSEEENSKSTDVEIEKHWKLLKKQKPKKKICSESTSNNETEMSVNDESPQEDPGEIIPLSFRPPLKKKLMKKMARMEEERKKMKMMVPEDTIETVEISDSENSDVEIIEEKISPSVNISKEPGRFGKKNLTDINPFNYEDVNLKMFSATGTFGGRLSEKLLKQSKKNLRNKFKKSKGKMV
ncbi:exosome component 10-like [Octopus vulgaris]|uniref:Exosome complex component 10 homolog n=1 Tax=Octopus vulgaris TaxID=6645 RepID=A0AA36BCJ9_OCTVU|nr:exosome component 10-like [Octopus vulgaris]